MGNTILTSKRMGNDLDIDTSQNKRNYKSIDGKEPVPEDKKCWARFLADKIKNFWPL